MKNELVTIETSNQIIALSTEKGVKGIVQDAKEAIHSLDGGSMDTAAGRKKIRSNAFKATKLKTSLKERSEELIESIEKKIAPELKIIQGIKDNQKILGADLDQLRKDVNSEVDDHEKELKRIADEKEAEEKAVKDAKEKELLWDFAISENKLFDIDRNAEMAKLEAEAIAEEARLKQVQIDNDTRIAKEAAEAATIEAERLAQKAIDDAQEAKQKAIDDKIAADNELLASQARENLLNEQAAKEKLDKEWLEYISEAYEINEKLNAQAEQKRQSDLAEERRLAAIETERLAGIERQRVAQKKLDDEEAIRMADANNIRSINRSIYKAFVDAGVNPENAKIATQTLIDNKVPRITINY